MRQYGSYKPINLPWLREIPTHWTVLRNKNIFTEMKTEVGERSSEYTLLSLTLNGIIPRDVESGKGKFPEKFDKYKIVEPGNMAFCLFDIDETPRTVGLSSYAGMLTGAYTIMKVGNINSRWVYYYYLSLDNVKALRPLYSGLRKTINVNTFQGTKLPIPPRTEQDQIVRYLDWQVSKINKLIAAKKKEIALLREKRQIEIDNAVLGNCTQDKDMPWGLSIADGWNVIKFNGYFAFKKGLSITKKDLRDEGINVISYGQVHSKANTGTEIDDSLIRYVESVYLETSPNALVKKGDFIFADTSEDFEGVGNCVFVDRDDTIFAGYHTLVACPKDGKSNRYLAYLFKSSFWRYQLRKRVNGVKVYSITQRILKNAFVLLPPKDMQKDIVEYLDRKCETITAAIDKVNEEISVLEELKKKLISDVVTGQIDVRGIEVPDFEYVEDIVESSDEDEDSEETSDDEEV